MEERKSEVEKSHKISVCDREGIVISGVEDVESFDEKEIILYTSRGNLVLEGEEFKINKLSVESGDMEISGYLNGLKYSGSERQSGGFWAKIFR